MLEEINKFIFILDVGILFGKYVFMIEREAAVILNDAQLAGQPVSKQLLISKPVFNRLINRLGLKVSPNANTVNLKYIPDIFYIDRRFLGIDQASSSLSKGRFPIQGHFPFSISSRRIEASFLISMARAFFQAKRQIGRGFQTASKAARHPVGVPAYSPSSLNILRGCNTVSPAICCFSARTSVV